MGVPASGCRDRARGGLPRRGGAVVVDSRVASIQRARILSAAVVVIDELGYADTSVANIVQRARVSRRTFYETFTNREACLAAVFEDALARLRGELTRAGVGGLGWRERLRLGLWVVLSFLEREPALARVCLVQTLAAGPVVLSRREEVLGALAGVVDEGRLEGTRGGECTSLTAEGLVGAAFAIVHARLFRRGSGVALTGLFGELMALIVLPYLGSAAARRERERPVPQLASDMTVGQQPAVSASLGDPLQGVAMRLTYRTARVLEGVSCHPGASNREVAELAGIDDPGQVSRLLRRLAGLGLLENRCAGRHRGEPNRWQLTEKGARVAAGIGIDASRQPGIDASRPVDVRTRRVALRPDIAERRRVA